MIVIIRWLDEGKNNVSVVQSCRVFITPHLKPKKCTSNEWMETMNILSPYLTFPSLSPNTQLFVHYRDSIKFLLYACLHILYAHYSGKTLI